MSLTPGWQPHPYLAGGIQGWQQRSDIQPLTLTYGDIPLVTTQQKQAQPGEAIVTVSKIGGLNAAAQRVETTKALPYGALAGDIGWEPRTITLEGKLIGSYQLGDGAVRRLLDQLLQIDSAVLRVREPGIVDRWCVARLAQLQCDIEGQQVKTSPREVWAPYQMTLIADDPLWYSQRTLAVTAKSALTSIEWDRRGSRSCAPLAWWAGTGTATFTHSGGTLQVALGAKRADEAWAADFRTFGLYKVAAPNKRPLYQAGGLRYDGAWKGKWPNYQDGAVDLKYRGPAVTFGRMDAWL